MPHFLNGVLTVNHNLERLILTYCLRTSIFFGNLLKAVWRCILEVILITRRASDGKISETPKNYDNLKAVTEGCDLVLKTRLISGYCIKNAKTGEVIVKKGKV